GIEETMLTGQKVLSLSGTNAETRRLLYHSILSVYQSGVDEEATYFNPVLDKHIKTLRRKVGDGVLTIARNVTAEFVERVEKEQQLQLSNLILNTSLNGWFSCECIRDVSGRLIDFLITRVNLGFCRITGYAEKEVVGKSYLSVFPAAKRNGTFDLNRQVIETGQAAREEMQYKGDGLDAWYDVAVTTLGKDGLLVTFADITVAKRLALAAQQSADALQTVFDSAQTGMFTFAPEYNADGVIIDFRFGMVNSTITKYAGYDREILEGALGIKWFPGYLTNGEFDLYKHCYETGEPQRKEINYNLDGSDYYLYLQSVKIGDQLLVTITDYSLLRKSQNELEQTIKALERSNQSLEDFAHAASHDMKEPLRKIRVFTDRLKERLGNRMDDTERMLFDRIETSAERMELLVNDLLEFSLVSEKSRQLEPVNLNEKVQKVLADLELTIEEKGAQFKIDLLPTVSGNRQQLQQLFHNLIGNALKYSNPEKPPLITVRCATVSGAEVPLELPLEKRGVRFFLLEVADNGIGFQQQYAERIFEMFQRLHGKAEFSGTGVGLSIVRKIVQNHHGFVWATSEPGEGATFHVLLPT
ncbi:MAG TPA: ATP-binding protein, partial [Flavisolibacter sp.]|nr:ATP-binding protein [Flavisolibacter sp.]